jgi:hypothetical protein
VAAELLAEETLTLADVHQIATGLGVARHAHVPSPQLPGQLRAAKPVVCMEVPSVVTAAAEEPAGADRDSPTGAARRRPMLLALLPRRWRRATNSSSPKGVNSG